MLARCVPFIPKTTFVRNVSSKNVKVLNPSAEQLPYKGVGQTKKPVKVKLQAGKEYAYCACGLSTTQPFCDGSHKHYGRTVLRPVRFTVDQTAEYFLCNCKSTDHRPLCDGSHKQVDPTPASAEATRFVAFGESPVYEGVARDLGYKTKNGGFQ